jgi:hypothetical protein
VTRREVRVADSFFGRLDSQLGPERGATGEPSSTDFLVNDLPTIVEQFATEFDGLTEAISGVPSIRMFVGTGALVGAYVVQGIEIEDGVVELVAIDIDL